MSRIVQHHTVDPYLQVKAVVLFLKKVVVFLEDEHHEALDFLQAGLIEETFDVLLELIGILSVIVSPHFSKLLYPHLFLGPFSHDLIIICFFLHLFQNQKQPVASKGHLPFLLPGLNKQLNEAKEAPAVVKDINRCLERQCGSKHFVLFYWLPAID